MKDFVSMKTMTKDQLLGLLKRIEAIETGQVKPSYKKEEMFIANLFYEPSTRTKMSFEVAEKKLGLNVLDFHVESSSALKGETVYDTAKTFEAIGAKAIVIRHPKENAVQELAAQLDIPVINGGDGKGEHPTQSLLDLYTMYQEFGSFEGLKVTIVGDILHSRVARSNAIALSTLGADVRLSAKESYRDDTLDFPYLEIDEAVEDSDVIMLLRIQLERHSSKEALNKADYLNQYGLTIDRYNRLKEHAIVMHPAPVNRGVEIDDTLVEAEKSRIFKQMANGVYSRMAVIEMVLFQQQLKKGEIKHDFTYPERLYS
ncbi:aspartate carbamoyltransferase [Halolactibacillus miurensis]|uniref:Aspartate carbamoyltransferase n=1 Tax=Halolactibacillus miurensis TaxID=306541 RepID=A0A1I6QBA7_9BACI|nr:MULTISPECIES: aspartate carbamoyltransferase catalytic subunit [Halolactibacillus]GEM03495.1 aspartate carbamoyltransferase [Halolactibacillus miurensis]SFS49749.1 aspartate carbamoyltransferase catalytic subunit [Halolactibacillus miurensis]